MVAAETNDTKWWDEYFRMMGVDHLADAPAPHLLDKLVARANERHNGALNITKRPSLGWSISFMDGTQSPWHATFEEAARAALSTM